ncbi:MAG: sigma-54-dependent transcriptional regulator [Bacillota bacterium]
MAAILVIDDEKNLRWALQRGLSAEGYRVVTGATGAEGLDLAARERPDLVILDLRLPDLDGIEVLKRLRAADARRPVIMVTAHGAVETALKAMKEGAYDYVQKPFDLDEMSVLVGKALDLRRLEAEVVRLRDELDRRGGYGAIVGESAALGKVLALVDRLAETTANVIIYGESGTGKELVARAIHRRGPRSERPFVAVNCAALPETLLEDELFGHEKGAFTGATARRAGRFEQADGGTLFLDEVGEMSPALQAKLLRVIEEREFQRVGGREAVRVDVRLIAATNRDLKAAVEAGGFREDLYYRLQVVPIVMPPLRERREDVPLLVRHFIELKRPGGADAAGAGGANGATLRVAPEAMRAMVDYDWPGNVRELQNAVERALVVGGGEAVGLDDLPPEVIGAPGTAQKPSGRFELPDIPDEGLSLEDVERELLRRALAKAGGNQTRAARLLGVSRQTLIYRMQKYGLDA